MTLYGIDISNNNGADIDMNEVKAEGFDFVLAKVSEGDYFIDETWPIYRDAARAAGLALAGYHYVRRDCDIDAQADLFVRHLDGAAAMLDFESDSGGIDTFWALVRAINARGVKVALSYVPRWYWQDIGCPDLSQVPGLIQSAYVTSSGAAASAMYPGDDSPFWAAFGGKSVDILQFTDTALVAGHTVDANAFRGTRAELDELLAVPIPPTNPGVLMALTDAQQTDLYQKVCDIWDQTRGPGGAGWPQLGTNAAGQNLTPVDGEAELITEAGVVLSMVRQIAADVAELKGQKS
ncbi:GH25 family lysozyme [Nocardia sp. NPDC046763]|uniref:GH25 family lysozyme n=1 Tax=Nocardia sp. NPDC046763 TaxID=3155256 RepID=UPI0033F003C1